MAGNVRKIGVALAAVATLGACAGDSATSSVAEDAAAEGAGREMAAPAGTEQDLDRVGSRQWLAAQGGREWTADDLDLLPVEGIALGFDGAVGPLLLSLDGTVLGWVPNGVVAERRADGHAVLSIEESGEFLVPGGDPAPSASLVEDRELPPGCLGPEQVVDTSWVVTCVDPDPVLEERDWAHVDLVHEDGATERLLDTWWPKSWGEPSHASGHYRSAALSPDGRWVAAQHSGECESPTALLAEVGVPEPMGLLGRRSDDAFESTFHGWTPASLALAWATEGLCGQRYDGPGLYVVDPASGEADLLWTADEQPARIVAWGLVA